VFEFKMPDLGEGIAEGEILKWHVAVGDTVEEDAPLVDVETDKAAVTIPSPRAGKLTSVAGQEGDTVNVGDVVAVIDDGSGAAVATPAPAAEPAAAPAEVPAAAPTPAPTPAATVAAPAAPATPGRPVPAAPATRRLARELKVDINLVPPTGPGGRVTPDDVRTFAAGGAPAVTPEATPEAAVAAAAEHIAAKAVVDDAAFAEFAAHASSTIPFLELEPLPDFSVQGPV